MHHKTELDLISSKGDRPVEGCGCGVARYCQRNLCNSGFHGLHSR